MAELLKHELRSTEFFLIKDGYLRKSTKSEFVLELETALDVVPTADVPRNDNLTMITADFIAYARRVPAAKLKVETYEGNYGALLAICNIRPVPSKEHQSV